MDPRKPSALCEKRTRCVFPISCEVHVYLRPVMAFPGPFTYPGTGVSKTNAGHRNAAFVRGNSQSLLVCFVLSLSSSCPVNLSVVSIKAPLSLRQPGMFSKPQKFSLS